MLALRHQLNVLERSVKRPKLIASDRFFWAWAATWRDWRSALIIVKPETVIGWHRKGFRLFWMWKSRHGRRGRPAVPAETRQLIRRMSRDNPLWGAPRIHGELLKLGIDIGDTSVGKYMMRGPRPPSQTWRTFLENHLKTLVSIDFLTVPTLRFQILYVFLVLAHERRRILHFAVTAHPTAEWTAQELREAFPWDSAPRFLLRDRDHIFGSDFTKQVEELGIEEVLGAVGAPQQRAYIERVSAAARVRMRRSGAAGWRAASSVRTSSSVTLSGAGNWSCGFCLIVIASCGSGCDHRCPKRHWSAFMLPGATLQALWDHVCSAAERSRTRVHFPLCRQ